MEILQQKNVTPVNAKLLCYLDQLNLILVSIWPISFWPMLNLPWRGIIEYGRKQEEKKRINRKGICVEMSSFHGKGRFSVSWHMSSQ